MVALRAYHACWLVACETIATLPANSTVQLLVQCGVTANGQ
jgi:hypothetical protein